MQVWPQAGHQLLAVLVVLYSVQSYFDVVGFRDN
jgi:hypothetical protein